MDQRTHEQGRHERFAELYAAYYRPLVAFCRRLVNRSSDAEELAQEAFLRAWASWDRYAPARPFWPWVSTIARRLCIDHGRRLRTARRKDIDAHSRDELPDPSPEELVETDAEYRWARAALAQLRPEHRRVLSLREVEGWSYDRIADHEGVTVESVRGSLRRARVGLRAAYARIVSSAPVVVVLALVRSMRRQAENSVQRVQNAAASGAPIAARAGDAVAAILALALGTGGAGALVFAPGASVAQAAAGGPRPTVTAVVGDPTTTTTDGARHMPSTRGGGATMAEGGGAARDHQTSPLPVVVPGRGPGVPEGSNFQSFTASPNYAKDHVVYASGFAAKECNVTCPVLFRSDNAGASWTRIRGFFTGGTVMLPPSYPNDSRLFVINEHSLRVSEDGGVNYRPLTPAGGFAAMSPGFSSSDRHILVGAIPGWIYHDDTAAVTPFDLVPESTSVALSFAYSPAYPSDGRLLVGGTDGSPMQNGVVSVCRQSACTTPAPLAGSTATPAVFAARSYPTSGLAFAWHLDHLYRSVDGGVSFAPRFLPTAGEVHGLADDAVGNLYLAQWSLSGGTSAGGLFVSHDNGTTWTRLGAGTPLEHGAMAVSPMPDGRLLAAPWSATGGGLLCSADGGQSWAPRCP